MNARRLLLIAFAATLTQPLWVDPVQATTLAPAEVRAIAKEAYIYGYPKPEALNGRWIPPKAQPAQTDNASPTKP